MAPASSVIAVAAQRVARRAMRDDYHVPFQSEQYIADLALEWRKVGGINYLTKFNIVNFFNDFFIKAFKRGPLQLKLYQKDQKDRIAYVSYNPFILNAHQEIWQFAFQNDPFSRHVIAHELGHLLLHDHNAKSFSSDPDLRIKFSDKEHSSEWQADCFASHFLAPDFMVVEFPDPQRLADFCDIPIELAKERFVSIGRRP